MKNGRTKSQSGLAAVEMLIAAPVLLILLSGFVEVGNMFITYNNINKLAQNGIRYAVVDIYGTSGVSQVANESSIKNLVVYGEVSPGGGATALVDNLTPDDVQVSQAGDYVTITVSHDYEPIMGAFNDAMNFDVTFQASSTMFIGQSF
ncbi:pilus assembly protein [Vibrio sp. S4M6]|uniref:TadE/TadG family type IV pilus assembly protein n=1 Tax=Vibrio sinus TaxID=2946865 RepID=UPI00202A77CD|nr:TadE family protein [Vibrio sinus]MCL9781442.1 pilus assembly protein [Vibrio sinus]